ncbi:MAG: gfo/Idh/MocA family oxidoreductase, partial [Phycisphaerae bacterium]|nr:gfo/Idh/MocA family oxidoreductase [Phycisphaerae bacterium]
YFTWLSGDHIVEQHVHNIDVLNWAFDAVPKTAVGVGGREVRKGEIHGNIFDHFTVEYEYPNGVRIMSMCKQIRNSTWRVGERIVGTKGVATSTIGSIQMSGDRPYELKDSSDCLVQEHKDLIESIRSGTPLNEGERIAMSTLTAIAGRISAYTARPIDIQWLLNESKLDLLPPEYKLGPLEVRPVAVPGVTVPV